MGRLFGTDGVRGLANDSLSPELALGIAAAAATVLGDDQPAADCAAPRGLAIVGRDPRASGEMLEAAITAGLTSAGMDVLSVGVLPTPAVAYLTDRYGAKLGVMISASHNPMPDNGIKIFAAGGHKLDDVIEDRIEAMLSQPRPARPTGAGVGRVRTVNDTHQVYVEHLVSLLDRRLDGLTVVVDCANGAASEVGPSAYRAAGATVVEINAAPDGCNINDGCGSTHLEPLRQAVVRHGADLGIAHDGDADRCLAVDARGEVVDGDALMAILALAMHEHGELADNTLVATVMSNLGLLIALRAAGIEVRTTAVGDRYVLEELRSGGYSLGGEQSGHVVFPTYGTTGDGILTALLVMARMAETGRSLRALADVFTPVPQVLINVAVTDKTAVAGDPDIASAVAETTRALGDSGRVLLRPSGTEQLIRVMVEATDADLAQQLAEDLAKRVTYAGGRSLVQ